VATNTEGKLAANTNAQAAAHTIKSDSDCGMQQHSKAAIPKMSGLLPSADPPSTNCRSVAHKQEKPAKLLPASVEPPLPGPSNVAVQPQARQNQHTFGFQALTGGQTHSLKRLPGSVVMALLDCQRSTAACQVIQAGGHQQHTFVQRQQQQHRSSCSCACRMTAVGADVGGVETTINAALQQEKSAAQEGLITISSTGRAPVRMLELQQVHQHMSAAQAAKAVQMFAERRQRWKDLTDH
jgi:hypothetical protein